MTSAPPVATATASLKPRPTAHPPTPPPSPTQLPGTVQIELIGAPRGTAPDVPDVDAVIDAVAREDVDALAQLMRMQQVACVADPGIGQPPVCPAGVAAGTAVSVFPVVACEGGWSRDPRQPASDLIDAKPELIAVVGFDATRRHDVVFVAAAPRASGLPARHAREDARSRDRHVPRRLRSRA